MLSRRTFLKTGTALSAVAAAGRSLASGRPVILDTDIGDDVDDTWALLMLLRMPELDLKLAVSDYGNAIYRCRLLAKLLQLTGRTDVPIGVGGIMGPEDAQAKIDAGATLVQVYTGLVYEGPGLVKTILQGLTEAGRVLYERSRRGLQDIEEAESEVSRLRS